MSIPISVLQNKPGTQIWMTNIVERYESRPRTNQFEEMNLAFFSANFTPIGSSDLTEENNENLQAKTFKLQNNKGTVRKRKTAAVIRFPKFQRDKDAERYFENLLRLYLPHRGLSLPSDFNSFESYYQTGYLVVNLHKMAILSYINEEIKKYNLIADVEEVWEDMPDDGTLEDAWAQMAPVSEEQRDEESKLVEEIDPEELELEAVDIPELHAANDFSQDGESPAFSIQPSKHILSSHDAYTLKSSLNKKQREIFEFVRSWAMQKRHGHAPKPLKLFITGGAGLLFHL